MKLIDINNIITHDSYFLILEQLDNEFDYNIYDFSFRNKLQYMNKLKVNEVAEVIEKQFECDLIEYE